MDNIQFINVIVLRKLFCVYLFVIYLFYEVHFYWSKCVSQLRSK